jgi:hypothetical protein
MKIIIDLISWVLFCLKVLSEKKLAKVKKYEEIDNAPEEKKRGIMLHILNIQHLIDIMVMLIVPAMLIILKYRSIDD